MLVNLNEVLPPAKKGHYAVGLFNTVNSETVRGVLQAALASSSPVVMGTAQPLFHLGPIADVSYLLLPLARKADIPVVVHLDRGRDEGVCLRALQLGFSSLMYDLSASPYEQNVERVCHMAEVAHAFDATIEGALLCDASVLTADIVKDYVSKTGVDALALLAPDNGAVDFDLVRAISGAVDVPLVLHTECDLGEGGYQKAVDSGFCAIDAFPSMDKAACQAAASAGGSLAKLIPAVTQAVCAEAQAVMKCLGSAGQAVPQEG